MIASTFSSDASLAASQAATWMILVFGVIVWQEWRRESSNWHLWLSPWTRPPSSSKCSLHRPALTTSTISLIAGVAFFQHKNVTIFVVVANVIEAKAIYNVKA